MRLKFIFAAKTSSDEQLNSQLPELQKHQDFLIEGALFLETEKWTAARQFILNWQVLRGRMKSELWSNVTLRLLSKSLWIFVGQVTCRAVSEQLKIAKYALSSAQNLFENTFFFYAYCQAFFCLETVNLRCVWNSFLCGSGCHCAKTGEKSWLDLFGLFRGVWMEQFPQ